MVEDYNRTLLESFQNKIEELLVAATEIEIGNLFMCFEGCIGERNFDFGNFGVD